MANGNREQFNEFFKAYHSVQTAHRPLQAINRAEFIAQANQVTASPNQADAPATENLSSSIFFELIIAAKNLTTVVPLIQTVFSVLWQQLDSDKVEPFDDDELIIHREMKILFRDKIAQTSPTYWELDETKKPKWCMTFSALRATCNDYVRNIPDNYKTMHHVAINQLEALVALVGSWAKARPGAIGLKFSKLINFGTELYRQNGPHSMILAEIAMWLSVTLAASPINGIDTKIMLDKRIVYLNALISQKIISDHSHFKDLRDFIANLTTQLEALSKKVELEASNTSMLDKVQNIREKLISGLVKNQFQWLYYLLNNASESGLYVFNALSPHAPFADKQIYQHSILGDWIKKALLGLGIKGETFEIHTFMDFASIDNLFAQDLPRNPEQLEESGLWSHLSINQLETHGFLQHLRQIIRSLYELALVSQYFNFLEEVIQYNGEDWLRINRAGHQILNLFIVILLFSQNKLMSQTRELHAILLSKPGGNLQSQQAFVRARACIESMEEVIGKITQKTEELKGLMQVEPRSDSQLDELLLELYTQLKQYADRNNIRHENNFVENAQMVLPGPVVPNQQGQQPVQAIQVGVLPPEPPQQENIIFSIDELEQKTDALEQRLNALIGVGRMQRRINTNLLNLPNYSLFKGYLQQESSLGQEQLTQVKQYENGNFLSRGTNFSSEILNRLKESFLNYYQSYYNSSSFVLWFYVKSGKIDEFRKMYQKVNAIFSLISQQSQNDLTEQQQLDIQLVEVLLVDYLHVFCRDVIKSDDLHQYLISLVNLPNIYVDQNDRNALEVVFARPNL